MSTRHYPGRFVATVAALSVCVSAQRARAQQSDAEFDRQNRVADMLRLLDARPGSVIADVGAGDGMFTIPIARAVGPSGRAVAVDISKSALTKLRDRTSRERISNVEAILGATDDPHLPAGQFDAALIHNAYHEMTDHEAMLRHIFEALKPGGRLLIVEPMHGSSKGLPRERQVANHDIEIDIVDRELRAAGFAIRERDDEFIPFTGVPGGFWLLLAQRE
jgi:predicted methyltransferase